jgi:predicted RNA-binding protein YlqC (UPF0109 family)
LIATIKTGTERGKAMKDLITVIVQALADQPDQVSAAEIVGDHANLLDLRVAKSDMGKVLGKKGRTAQA